MTTEERELLYEIHRALKGDGLSQDKGLVYTVIELKKEVEYLREQLRMFRTIFKGIAIGLVVAGILFGAVSWEAFVKFVKGIL